jgi:hypothetical protein
MFIFICTLICIFIYVYIGSGHHTNGPQKGLSRLLPAVQQLLDTLGLKYREVRDDNGYVGGLNVKFKKFYGLYK